MLYLSLSVLFLSYLKRKHLAFITRSLPQSLVHFLITHELADNRPVQKQVDDRTQHFLVRNRGRDDDLAVWGLTR